MLSFSTPSSWPRSQKHIILLVQPISLPKGLQSAEWNFTTVLRCTSFLFSIFDFLFWPCVVSEWVSGRETERHREKIELDREVKHWLLKEIQRVSVLSVLRVCLCVYVSSIRRPLLEKIWIVFVCVTVRVRSRMRDIWAIRSPAWYLRPSFFIFRIRGLDILFHVFKRK